MGCASSKGFESEFASEKSNTGSFKGISVPSLPLNLPNDFHVVSLTSSTYGILKVEEDCKESTASGGAAGSSVKDVLNKLNNLESKVDDSPQSWLEVSSMLENLKPELVNPTNAKSSGKPQQAEAIDVKDMMLDLDEDTGLFRPKARKLADLKRAGKSLPIRTLEELDKRFAGKMNDTKNESRSPVAVVADARALLKPVGTAKADRPARVGKIATISKQPSGEQTPSPVMACNDEIELLDKNFLDTYKNAFSEDEWEVVETPCNGEGEGRVHHNLTNEQLDLLYESMNMGKKEEHAAKISFGSDDIFSLVEGEESLSSSARGSPSAASSSMDLPVLIPDSPACAPIEEDILVKSPLEGYEELCPPGGKDGVVLYMTSLRSIRRTYEDCAKAREIMKTYGVLTDERDVSMHLEYRNELRELMQRVVTVPRLFVKGRYIGGVEMITKLAQDGQLMGLLEGAIRGHGGDACPGCAGAKFVPCLDCNGSCKVVGDKKHIVRCLECNENGLIHCPICS